MSRFHYCTIASNNHLFKVIAMHNSLASKCTDYKLSILCFDREVYEVLSVQNWSDTELIRLETIENEELLKAKANRHGWEYAWSLKPTLLRNIMLRDTNADYYAFFDADIYFFSNPNSIFDEAPGANLFLTDHNNSASFAKYYDISGKFNSGFVGCRNSPTAAMAIDWWGAKTIDWCYARFDMENKRYGDQRYLEQLPELFPGIHIVRSKGANVAHWNIENYTITPTGNNVFMNSDRLIFYHYSGLFIYNSREYNLSWATHIPENAVQHIYIPYLRDLGNTIETIEIAHPRCRNYGYQRPDAGMELHYVRI